MCGQQKSRTELKESLEKGATWGLKSDKDPIKEVSVLQCCSSINAFLLFSEEKCSCHLGGRGTHSCHSPLNSVELR